MRQVWKVGLIKLVSSPESFNQWRPISLMGGLYKIFTKVLTNRLQKYLPKLIHLAQYGFIVGRNILHNMLNVQMTMDCACHTHQELIMVQFDLEKVYDSVIWFFVFRLMHTLDFRPRMCCLIFLLGQYVVS